MTMRLTDAELRLKILACGGRDRSDVPGGANEVRIFPLLTCNGEPSPFVEPLVERLREAGHAVSVEAVPYEFRRGGNQMMRIISANTN